MEQSQKNKSDLSLQFIFELSAPDNSFLTASKGPWKRIRMQLIKMLLWMVKKNTECRIELHPKHNTL